MGFFKRLFGIGDDSKEADSSNSNNKVKSVGIPIDIKITTSFGYNSSTVEKERFNNIIEVQTNGWLLNPAAPFSLTLIDVTEKIANQVREILDDDQFRDYNKTDKLIALFTEYNVKVKEIEEYKSRYKNVYYNKLEELKRNSKEWLTAGELDKEDLLIEFRESAIKEIYERADCDLDVLFEYEPLDVTIDDELIKDYGFDCIKTYVKFSNNLQKVRIVPNDNYTRPIFEKLVELSLAERGINLPKEEILATLSLKELNLLAKESDKVYNRKNQAIQYLLGKDELLNDLGKFVSLRELFKLKPLPDKYKNLDLKQIARSWNYHEQEVRLLTDTYRNSYYSWRNFKDQKYIKSYSVEPLNKLDPCPCAKDLSQKFFSKNNPPKLPFHIGCNCFLKREYDFSDTS